MIQERRGMAGLIVLLVAAIIAGGGFVLWSLNYHPESAALPPIEKHGKGQAQSTSTPSDVSADSSLSSCFPASYQLDYTAEYQDGKNITIGQKLKMLGASCTPKGLLVDRSGRAIALYSMGGCGGTPPPRDIQDERRAELKKLKEDHTVIEIGCSPESRLVP